MEQVQVEHYILLYQVYNHTVDLVNTFTQISFIWMSSNNYCCIIIIIIASISRCYNYDFNR
ncbi:hypothetical protein NUU61_004667 [Penicillium alfredii]|uniref:Uncharacterized protein n=1 Tax=Penicillium alfredii TaxID=1506179 RepID=A0A9W9F756_9EURO|nr:uncharacterized protein NUU61_005914 [Penicillium alfredii]XP_056512056.1 uncharacterized protein NUU61_004667 [Penicillium alfredii]KAJ5094881.1 hypothetical protein NUU61_005914 [Penicillium alfredii]KAJ5097807.1 hypothetical protein NUU61_004667 [Penicillium alfredii]